MEWKVLGLRPYDGPYEGLNLIEDEVFDTAMQSALEGAGYHTVLLGGRDLGRRRADGFRVIQLTDRKSWRRRIVVGDVTLAARPR